MSDVHLLDADPHKRTATFRWITSGMRKLNRKNKISSPAFQCPPLDSVPPECSFRLVALRGVVKAPQESDDQYGLFVEWMRTGTAPGSVKVAFTFGPPDSSSRLTASVFGQLSTTEVTLGLKEVFTPAQYESLCFPETDALCVDVTLAFDVPVLDTVVKVSKSFGSSLWGGASTTFSVVGSAVSAWGGRVTALLDDAFHFGREEVVNHSASTQACPWDAYPSKWIDRPQRWTFFLTQYLPQNEAVFTVAPRSFTSDEELLLIEAGLSANACTAAAQSFDFDRDVHAALLGPEQRLLRTMRFDLVPGRVSEVDFWRNYFWRIECLKLCATDEQAQILLSILNAPVQGQSVSTVTTHAWKQACENCDTACTLSEEILEEGVSDANAEMLRAVTASVRLAAETLSCLSLADLGTPEDATVVKTAIERSEVVSRKTAEALRQYDAAVAEKKAAPPAAATPAMVEAVSLPQRSEEKADTQPPAPATLSSSPPQPSPTKAEDTTSNSPQTPPGAAAAPPPSDSAAAASPPRATSEPQSKFALMPWEEEDP